MILLLFIVKTIIGSGILFCYYRLFLRNKRFHHYNRFYLLINLLLPPVIALINIPIFSQPGNRANEVLYQTVDAFTINTIYVKNAVPLETKTWLQNLGWQSVSMFVYITISFVLLFLLVRSLRYIQRLRFKYPYRSVKELKIYNTIEPGTPFSFFQSIFWNEEIVMDSKEGQQIFRHELFHVQQKHSADILFAEIMSAIFWVNPFIHLIRKELRAIHEFLADQYAIHNNDSSEYATLLIKRILQTNNLAGSNYFFQNHIKRRIAMITQFKNKKYGYASRVMALPLCILLFCGIALYAQQSPKENKPIAKDLTLAPPTLDLAPITLDKKDTIPTAEKKKLEAEIKELEKRKEKIIEAQAKELEKIQKEQQKLIEKMGGEFKGIMLLDKIQAEKLNQEVTQKLLLRELDQQKLILKLKSDDHLSQQKIAEEKMHLLLDKIKADDQHLLLSEPMKDKMLLKQLEVLKESQNKLIGTQKAEALHRELLLQKLKQEEKNLVGTQLLKDKMVREQNMQLLDKYKEMELEEFKKVHEAQWADRALRMGMDTTVQNIQRHFNRNLRYPAELLSNGKEGEVYISVDLNGKAEVTDYVIHRDAPITNGFKIFETVVVAYAPDKPGDSKELNPQELFNAEVERAIKKYKPVNLNSTPQRIYFKILFKLEK